MPTTLPSALFTCEQTRAIDSAAINDAKIPGIVLMKRAGKAAFEKLRLTWPDSNKIVVVCGGGNNGGDGYVVAALARQRNVPVEVYSLVPVDSLTGDARRAFLYAQQENVEVSSANELTLDGVTDTVIVDAMLGTGFRGELKPAFRDVTKTINNSELPVFALDIPSGLEGDTGAADVDAIDADLTLTFVAVKQGLLTGRGPALSGQVCFDDLAIPAEISQQFTPSVFRVSAHHTLPSKPADAHKKDFGHLLVVGGDLGMGGAAMLAAEAALRSGAGLVTLATRPEHIAASLARLPEVMALGISGGPELAPLVEKVDAIVVGPGLGQSAWSEQLLYFALKSNVPTVVDADALNIIGKNNITPDTSARWVITPHPGEASRLLNTTTNDIQADRFTAVKALQARFGVTVLKGAGSLISTSESTMLAQVGNAGMAVAGMGDVLSGVIGALLAQGLSLEDAAVSGVCAHGNAGDLAAQSGERGIRASDLMPFLRKVLNA